jgi:putative transposase
MNELACLVSVTRTLRLKVKPEAGAWLSAAATEVNTVWNWANEISAKAARPFAGKPKWLSGFDLNNLSAGATRCFDRIGADTIQRVNCEYAVNRRAAKRCQLRWRVSRGTRRSLGWVPFKAVSLKRKGASLRFCGKTFRVFEPKLLEGVKWQQGCFAQDAVGDWWLGLPVRMTIARPLARWESVGIDLGLKDIAVASDGDRCAAGGFYRGIEEQISQAQRRGHKRQAKRLHRKAANRRRDALHKFSRRIVDRYRNIVVGDVSSARLAQTRMAKAVMDSGWSMLRQMLQYKGEHTGRSVSVVCERYTSRTCSTCGSLTGPRGVEGLRVRRWLCVDCGESHDRDVNAARNILRRAEVSASVSGNELTLLRGTPESTRSREVREPGQGWGHEYRNVPHG